MADRTTIDFETRSAVKLKVRGVAIYAMHESTVALCLAYRTPAGLKQWIWDGSDKPEMPHDLRRLVEDGFEFHAFNAAFERYVWEHVCVNKWGWSPVPLSRWRCTLAIAANANQPQSLEKLSSRLQLKQKKMKEGKTLIAQLTEPLNYAKAKKVGLVVPKGELQFYPWSETDNFCRQFLDYNKVDVIAEEEADAKLPEWNPAEIAVWQMDRRINERGFHIDKRLCEGAARIHKVAIAKANQMLAELTGGKVTKCTQVQRIKKWLIEEKRANLEAGKNGKPTLNEQSVNRWLSSNSVTHPEAATVLRLRLHSNSNTVTKYASALNRVGAGDRVRESVRYYGAATGRWTGSGFHPHNFKREAAPAEVWFDLVAHGDYDLLEAMSDTPGVEGVISVLKKCVRGIITAPRGRKLITSDFAGIEARVLHWLCGNEKMLKLFREDQDIYIAAACDIYDRQPADIATWNGKKWKIQKEHNEKRQVGKQAQLGLGYGMGGPKFVANMLNKENLVITEEFATKTVQAWRAANQKVVQLWADVNNAARHAAENPKTNGAPTRLVRGKLVFEFHPRNYLTIRLPSGRKLFYYKPRIRKVEGYRELYYVDGSKETGKGVNTEDEKAKLEPGEIKTYGGKLVENIVQAISRDLLVNSLQIIERAGLEPIFHVHDESVTEVEDARADEGLKVVHKAMETVPNWAIGLPLMAETKMTQRYEK